CYRNSLYGTDPMVVGHGHMILDRQRLASSQEIECAVRNLIEPVDRAIAVAGAVMVRQLLSAGCRQSRFLRAAERPAGPSKRCSALAHGMRIAKVGVGKRDRTAYAIA